MKKLIILILLMAGSLYTFAQEAPQSNNVLYTTFSYNGPYALTSLTYERRLFSTQTIFLRNVYAHAGAGNYWLIENQGYGGQLGITALSGNRKGHFEMQLGIVPVWDRDGLSYVDLNSGSTEPDGYSYFGTLPAISIGYRYQNADDHLLFRTGLGFPHGLYVGLGVNF